MAKITFNGIENVINPIYLKYLVKNQNPVQIFYGGSSSGKSHAIAQRVIMDVLEGRNYLIVRKTGDSLRRSTFNEVVSKIYDLQVQGYFVINKAEMIITCNLHNKQIMFRGLDDVEKLKSIKPLNGVITDIWLEEATECSYNDYKQLDKRLRGRSNFIKRITFSFNPIVRSHWIYEQFFKDRWIDGGTYIESDGVSILKTTYRDNHFLTKDDIERLESEKDPYYRMVYLDGEWGVLKGVIYDNWEIKNFDKESFGTYRVGVDWGFADDPFACIRVAIDIRRRELYVCDEIYKKGLLNDATIPLVKALAHGSVVWCDSAEPKSIAEYRSRGINAYGVKKGHGSIEQGINFVKRFHIYVHPTCKHTIDELSSYRYREDSKTGDILPEPIDKDNHLCVAKGTLIKTNKGNIAIENIKEGDYVLTRAGYKKVLAASKTGENVKTKTLITKKGNILFATHNHKIYNYYENRFLPLDTLRYGDKILICKGNVSYIRAKSGIVIQNLKKIIDILRRAINIYIIKYLKIITGNVRKAIIYIIKTVIRLITTPIILLKLVLKNTQLFIIRKIEKHLPENIYLNFQNWQKHGTNLKKGENGTESTRKNKVLENIRNRKRSVKIAVKHILQKQPIKSFVMRRVRQNIEESIKLILSKKYAQFVVPLLGQISIEGETLAPDSVRCVLDGSESDVYNLTIEDAHEYFANGILVKNCDALRYALDRDARMRGTIKEGL